MLYPFMFTPCLKDYIWGGRNLEKLYGRSLPTAGPIAESWEISAHADGTTRVANGRFAGMLLTELHQKLGVDLIGTANNWAQERGKFPLLVKLLDAHENLSVQVHPDDQFARVHERNELGKTEMWLVLEADPDAVVILGVKKGTTPDLFRQGIGTGQLKQYLHHIPVKKGDVICVPSRSLHAILGGVVIVEIQQNSNATYRVYDWNRFDAEGRSRMLHVDKAMKVINFDQIEPSLCQPELISDENGVARHQLCHNNYFVTERVEMSPGATHHGACHGRSLEIWGVLEGKAAVTGGEETVDLAEISFTLLPAALGDFTIKAQEETTLLRVYTPDA